MIDQRKNPIATAPPEAIETIGRFADAIAKAGLGFPDIIPDGEIHRFATPNDKHGQKSGWYVLYFDSLAGAFGDWKTGLNEKWKPGAEKLIAKERQSFIDNVRRAKHKRAAEERQRHEKVAAKAQEMLSCAAPAMWHPYLKQKRVLPLGIRQHNHFLVIPMTDTSGTVWNVQTINRDGNKRFLAGGRKKGLFHQIGGPVEDHFYIAEGWATAATVHMYLKKHAPVVVAFDAGNLKPVARALHKHYPGIGITITADNDCWGPVNTGLTKAREAAAVVGAKLLYPTWENVDTSAKPSDFNDLYVLGGL